MNYTREEWEEILQDSGVPKNSARIIAPSLKQRIDRREKEKKEKVVVESKDMTEPLSTYKIKKEK